MADGIEETVGKVDTTKDPNEGKSMLDFVKSEIGVKPEDDAKSNAQELGKTEPSPEEQEAARVEKEKADKEREELLANETLEEKTAREAKEKADKEAENEEAVEDEQVEEKDKGPVPYERFEEVNNKYKVTVEEYEKVKPLAESHQQIQSYCEQWGITQDQFRNLLDIQRLLNTEPEKALAKILPIVESVQGFTGDRLPPDLQKEVDQAQITLERAREVAKLRAQTQFGGQRFQQYQQIQLERQQQQFMNQQVKAVNQWVAAKAKGDPDFKPRKDANSPRGRFEFVYDAMQSMLAERDAQGQLVNVMRTPEDAPKLLEKAYQEVMKGLAPLTKRPATRKTLSQNGSTSRNTEVNIENAKTMGEAIRLAAAGHGL